MTMGPLRICEQSCTVQDVLGILMHFSAIGNDFSHITCKIETLTWVANEDIHTATKHWTNVKNYIQHRYPQNLN